VETVSDKVVRQWPIRTKMISGEYYRTCSHDFIWGALFFPQKLKTFLVVALKTQAKTRLLNWSLPISQFPQKCRLLLCLGCTLCLGAALTTFLCKFGPNFLTALVGAHALSAPPWLRLWSRLISCM